MVAIQRAFVVDDTRAGRKLDGTSCHEGRMESQTSQNSDGPGMEAWKPHRSPNQSKTLNTGTYFLVLEISHFSAQPRKSLMAFRAYNMPQCQSNVHSSKAPGDSITRVEDPFWTPPASCWSPRPTSHV